MSGTWSKLKKTLLFKSNAAPASSSQLPPRVPNQSDSSSPTPRSSISSSSSSFSSRFSRSLSTSSRSSKKTCAICLGNVRIGQGQAIFTAECSHTFHFSCITNSVRHGNYLCPICRSKWKEIPLQLASANADANRNAAGRARVSPYQAPFADYPANYSRPQQQLPPHRPEPVRYNDDEPLPASSTDPMMSASCAPSNNVSVKTIPEFPAVAAPQSVSDFAVLVGVRAPPLIDGARQCERAPIDLVTVLDVSGSMAGSKLLLLKCAVCFVIENLGPADRLSIVSFSSSAHRILPLLRMTDRGREDAKAAVNSLFSDGGTDIVEGLKKGARILEERRERNPVASIILLSDGKHTFNCISARRSHQNQTSSYPPHILELMNLLPVSLCPNNRELENEDTPHSFPVHAFGFGVDHDSSTMHAISDASGGTFSFIESVDMVQEAFARCIGGLLSVVAQELRLTVTSASSGVAIDSIPSGRYATEISDRGFQAVVNVGDLYADEEKEFLVHLSIPECPIAESEGTVGRTSLLKIACSYRDTASKAMVQLEGEQVEIRRPKVVSRTDGEVSLEVDRQRNRLWVAESIAKAQEMAESGNLEGAQTVLARRRTTLLSSASAQAGDSLCSWLEAELMEIRERMENMAMYEHTGRAYVLSGLSSHSWQRATTRGYSANLTTIRREGGSSSYSVPVGYDTPSMVSMVSKSQNLSAQFTREQVSRQNKSTPLANT
ncbi:E3 ubiquitin-protein ligase WAV3 [Sesamum alatum]|uniref:E3 ubiquitin-protein ligase WAV3 n=1 Tax=Sesamum alatum TaxID=300844 RepID=A0AAE1Z1T7_9LAMI|nr:E3 ubiquitin-protein ligase WAV3 [Sesamum alatum]